MSIPKLIWIHGPNPASLEPETLYDNLPVTDLLQRAASWVIASLTATRGRELTLLQSVEPGLLDLGL